MIDQQLDAAFIHVSNIPNAVVWYSRLLGLPKQEVTHEGMIYDLPLNGSAQVILDGYSKPVSPHGTGTRVMFTTSDLPGAHDLALSLSDDVSEILDIGSSLIFYLQDPDGNLICIRQPKPTAE